MTAECTCKRRFLDAEDYRDHLPCDGGTNGALRREVTDLRRRLAAVEAERDVARVEVERLRTRMREEYLRTGDMGAVVLSELLAGDHEKGGGG